MPVALLSIYCSNQPDVFSDIVAAIFSDNLNDIFSDISVNYPQTDKWLCSLGASSVVIKRAVITFVSQIRRLGLDVKCFDAKVLIPNAFGSHLSVIIDHRRP